MGKAAQNRPTGFVLVLRFQRGVNEHFIVNALIDADY
jgi:hypothetical protein